MKNIKLPILSLLVVSLLTAIVSIRKQKKQITSSNSSKLENANILIKKDGQPSVTLLHKENSVYGDIKVFEFMNKSTRCGLVSGIMLDCYAFTSNTADSYTANFAKYLLENESKIDDVLIIGIGTGSLLKMIDNASFKVTGVEINKKLPRIAEKYFGLPENLDYEIVVDDGRNYLQKTDKKFDVIVMDICDVHEYSAHLWTNEFFKLAKSKLKNESSLLLAGRNTVENNKDSEKLDQLVDNAILNNFNYLYEVKRNESDGENFNTITYLASDNPPYFEAQEILKIEKKVGDYAQDDHLGKLINLGSVATRVLRNQTIENFGEELLLY